MTETATAGTYRPSPKPRPAAGQSRPDSPHLHVVRPDSEVPTSGNPADTPTETITAGQNGSSTAHAPDFSDIDFRTRTGSLWQASKAYWTPPAVFTDRPASLAELAEYARHAPWTAQQTGIVRKAGIGYQLGVAYPYTVISRYREWFAQRPLRFAALLTGVKLASMTGPGAWVVDHLVYPAARFAGHIFL